MGNTLLIILVISGILSLVYGIVSLTHKVFIKGHILTDFYPVVLLSYGVIISGGSLVFYIGT